MYRYPEGVYSDVRIEHRDSTGYTLQNGEVTNDNETSVQGAMVRVYDGDMWYTSVINDLDGVQAELDALAAIAKKNEDIASDPVVRLFEVHKDRCIRFDGDDDTRKVTREQRSELVHSYADACFGDGTEEIKNWSTRCFLEHVVKEFYSSKGAELVHDYQQCGLFTGFQIVIDGNTTSGGKGFVDMSFGGLSGRVDEVKAQIDRYMTFAREAVDVEPGDHVCVLSPEVNAFFTHESFGHKSEADSMLSDKALRDEWVMGKQVGNVQVSIYDSGDEIHHGYIAYDDEGTLPRPTWLIKNGVLTGRLHDANSAAILGEELTGNARAEDFSCSPIVRMTNTYMEAGSFTPEEIFSGVKNGIYVYSVTYGTGFSTFTMKPDLCYRIRDGKICEPVRANVITGSVFKTLFDIDAVGNDFCICDELWCGKSSQTALVSAGGPTIRVKSLHVN